MGENSTAQRLTFTTAAPTPNQHVEGVTVYEAKANGVTYRVLGTLVDPMTSRRRVFRAYRVTGKTGHTLHPAGPGGARSTRAAACAQAEADLAEVLRDRAVVANPMPAPAREQQMAGRKLRGPAHAHLDAPCTDACYEPETRSLNSLMGQPDAVPGEPSAWTVFHDTMSAAIRAADAAVRAAAAPEVDPATEDNVGELVDRIVRRAQYEALKAMLGVLAGWIEGARSNCMADGHRGEAVPCGVSFHVEDIRNMINDAARELGTVEPWKATSSE